MNQILTMFHQPFSLKNLRQQKSCPLTSSEASSSQSFFISHCSGLAADTGPFFQDQDHPNWWIVNKYVAEDCTHSYSSTNVCLSCISQVFDSRLPYSRVFELGKWSNIIEQHQLFQKKHIEHHWTTGDHQTFVIVLGGRCASLYHPCSDNVAYSIQVAVPVDIQEDSATSLVAMRGRDLPVASPWQCRDAAVDPTWMHWRQPKMKVSGYIYIIINYKHIITTSQRR